MELNAQEYYYVISSLAAARQDALRNSEENPADKVAQYIATRSAEADRLMESLDDELLSPAERQEIAERLNILADELKRGDRARRKLESQATAN